MNLRAPLARILAAPIRTQLFGLAIAVALPFVVLLSVAAVTAVDREIAAARASNQHLAEATAHNVDRFIARTRQTLEVLAARANVRALDPDRCDDLVAIFPTLGNGYANLVTLEAAGPVGIHEAVRRFPTTKVSSATTCWNHAASDASTGSDGTPSAVPTEPSTWSCPMWSCRACAARRPSQTCGAITRRRGRCS